MDREKVIKGLECCKNKTMLWQHDQCPYHGFDEDCESNLHADALAMLKGQERKTGSWDYGTQCSVCKGTIIPPKDRKVRVNFCPWCGADMRDSYEQEGR